MKRLISFFVLLTLFWYMPNVALACVIVFAVVFPAYWEGIAIGFFADGWYGFAGINALFSFRYALLCAVIIITVEFFKRRMLYSYVA